VSLRGQLTPLVALDFVGCNLKERTNLILVGGVIMPRGDGTGPYGGGPGTGRGMGTGTGRGRMGGNRPGAGPDGDCICPACGARVPHQVAVPCYNLSCPKCGAKMARE